MADEHPRVDWDPAQHPYWPPVDSDGKLIGDVPWKFFDPNARATRRVSGKMRTRQPAGHDGTHDPQEVCEA